MTNDRRNNPHYPDEQQRLIAATVNGVRIICAYVVNGQAVGTDKFAYKMAWLAALHAWVKEEMAAHPRFAILGDYNIAPDDRDVYDPVEWAGQIHCSTRARSPARAVRPGPGGRLPLVRAAGKAVQLVGLSPDGLPPQPRPAHRPHPALAGARPALQRLRHRPRAAQVGTAVGSRPGDRHD